jgi:hypothetical protein
MPRLLPFLSICLILLLTQNARAASVNVTNGIFTGATGINVNGILYDVSIGDGQCVGLYSGCDEQSDFPFNTSISAGLANSLLSALIIADSRFVNNPKFLNGCSPFAEDTCFVITPYFARHTNVVEISYLAIRKTLPPLVGSSIYGKTGQTSEQNSDTYAIWTRQPTKVTEPSSLMLLGIGMLGQRSLRKCSRRLPA